MFDGNLLTFNHRYTSQAETLSDFEDVQQSPKARGLELAPEADELTTGPAV
jgi:hypothetical protein